MKKRSYITLALGFLLVLFCLYLIVKQHFVGSPSGLIGLALIYIGFRPSRTGLVILGHSLIVVGAYLITWGLYLLPYSSPTFSGILLKPLFWGIFALFGGLCSLFHGFCNCVINFRRKD
jgi:hypothetical protein